MATVELAQAEGASPAASPWLVSAPFDLLWFFGGGLLSLIAIALPLYAGVPMALLFWIWLLGFDGPHMMAAYTRTYADRQAWQTKRRLLLITLLAFLVGPACLVVDRLAGSDSFTAFLGFATLYGLYHVIRQHYGFIALYSAKVGQRDALSYRIDRYALYLGAWLPYLAFVFTHPKARALLGLEPLDEPLSALVWATALGFGAALLAFVWNFLRTPARSLPKLTYSLLSVGLYGLAYYWVARFEPVYGASNGPDQDFLLLSVVLTVFHNVQYIALVYVHNRSRYVAPGKMALSGRLAPWISKTALRYVAVCLGFSLVYWLLAASSAIYPSWGGLQAQLLVGTTLGGISLNRFALALWWGLALHHYWLDQRIWRIKEDPELRVHLGLQAPR
ncbi:MAG: hypothetical protein H6718_35275 [Polyangiaceae bacterium]|nr:hypothetical protein [Polyangiaceae bacterium]